MNKTVLFFDGVCGLCSSSVDFVMAHDKENRIFFSPLQSDYAQKNLPDEFVVGMSSLVLKDDTRIYTKSDAVIRIGELLGGFWSLCGWIRIIPRPLRNLVYDFVARNRYKWFGKKESCRLPTAQEREKFLL